LKTKIYTVGEFYEFALSKLLSARVSAANLEARLLAAKSANISPSDVFSSPERVVSKEKFDILKKYLSRRLDSEPIAYILGEKEFWSLSFFISKATLIPRPETETVVECVLDYFPDLDCDIRILDLGTGSGCLLLSLLSEYLIATGVGVDISSDAIKVAIQNSIDHGMHSRAKFIVSDWREELNDLGDQFEVIVSNPPYISSADISQLDCGICRYEPLRALDGGPDGMGRYKEIFEKLSLLLANRGLVFIEIGIDQVNSVSKIAQVYGFDLREVRLDLSEIPRVLVFKK